MLFISYENNQSMAKYYKIKKEIRFGQKQTKELQKEIKKTN